MVETPVVERPARNRMKDYAIIGAALAALVASAALALGILPLPF